MPRVKKEEGAPVKTRSRHGCWPCKNRKIKCGEEKPSCLNCERVGEQCDYRIRLNWEGRAQRKDGTSSPWSSEHISLTPTPPLQSSPQNAFRASPSPTPGILFSKGGETFSPRYPLTKPDVSTTAISLTSAPGTQSRRSNRIRAASSSPYQSVLEYTPEDGHLKKRRRLSATALEEYQSQEWLNDHTPSGSTNLNSPPSVISPVTPVTSLVSDEVPSQKEPTINDLRRLSVKSLLLSTQDQDSSMLQPLTVDISGTVYGYDQGRPDLDIPRNDDLNALNVLSPNTAFRQSQTRAQETNKSEFGFGLFHHQDTHFERGGYYAEPIPVRIPPSLEPLPPTLKKNPMNLLYFHHFLNHTARLLVPLDCPENPFRSVLPQMAIVDQNLLHLLLAYAASHRARLLNHPDPINRIADLVSNVFPNLRRALENGKEGISNANLATAIMLASLEIISPNAFEIPVRWQDHLTIARQMIVARGGYQSLPRTDKGSYFLSRWFAYLDVLGSLSGSNYDRPLALACCFRDPEAPDAHVDDDLIDCLYGCTSNCIATLAKVADLAKQCDSQRIGLGGMIDHNWRPSPETFQAAEKLRFALQNVRTEEFHRCPHRLAEGDYNAISESDDMLAINECFHWAGLIHLYRRVYGKLSSDTEVQYAVAEIVAALDRTRFGGAAEASVIFPMFTAGCEAQDLVQREKILQRIKNVESYGMTQVNRARTLMEKVWDTGKPWETLVTGEFFG